MLSRWMWVPSLEEHLVAQVPHALDRADREIVDSAPGFSGLRDCLLMFR